MVNISEAIDKLDTKINIANEYNLLEFSNGTKLGLCGSNGYHRIYNDEAKEFTHTGTNDTPIGTHTFCQEGSYTELVKQTIINKDVEYYNRYAHKYSSIPRLKYVP